MKHSWIIQTRRLNGDESGTTRGTRDQRASAIPAETPLHRIAAVARYTKETRRTLNEKEPGFQHA
jgi:hypothetical protein